MAKRIVIIGGGFAGLNFAKNLNSKGYEVILVDRNNYLFFPPLLYQVATGFLEPSSISYPYRKMLRNKPNFSFKLGELRQIPFTYKDKGSMAIIGRNKAVVDIPTGLHFKGFFAWFIWIFIHLVSLVHYRNRITTVYNWVVAYFTKDQALRMIIRPD